MLYRNILTLEYGIVTDVNPDLRTITICGSRNLGRELTVPLTSYINAGVFGALDSSHEGRIPERGSGVLLLAEWSPGPGNHLIAVYPIGFLPCVNLVEGGYSAYSNELNEPANVGDWSASTSAKNFIKLSSSGDIRIESTALNFVERSAKENWCYEVSENKLTDVGGYIELIRYNELEDQSTYRIKVIFLKKPPDFAIKNYDDLLEALKMKNNIIIVEEYGQIDLNNFIFQENLTNMDVKNIVYRFSLINSGVAVYSKLIDSNGNVYEGSRSNFTLSINNTYFITVGNLFKQIASIIDITFGTITSTVSDIGSGIINFVASTMNMLIDRIDIRKR